MASWGEIERLASALARLTRDLLDAHLARDRHLAIDDRTEAVGLRSPVRK